MELITGRALFQTHENLEHLAMIERVVQPIPSDMVKRATKDAQRYFHAQRHSLLWEVSATRKSYKAVQSLSPLKRLLRLEADESVLPHLDPLHSLLSDMLSLSPSRRSIARHCLQHDFFRESIRSLLPKPPLADRSAVSASTARPAASSTQAAAPASRSAPWGQGSQPVAVRGSNGDAAALASVAAIREAPAKGLTAAQSSTMVVKLAAVAPATEARPCDVARGQGGATAVESATAKCTGDEKGMRSGGRLPPSTNGKTGASAKVPVATRVSARVASRQRARQDEAFVGTAPGGSAVVATAVFPSPHEPSKGTVLRAEVVEEEAPPSDVAEDLPWGQACSTSV